MDKQSQNTHVELDIFARQKSKAQSRVWIVQHSPHIAETYTKGTCAHAILLSMVVHTCTLGIR